MIRNYLRLGFRNIVRKKVFTAINLGGLSIASAFCILIYWYVIYEESFDKFHNNLDQLYRLEIKDIFRAGKEESKKSFFSSPKQNTSDQNLIATPVILAAELKKNFPEIENCIRIAKGTVVVHVNNQGFREENNVAFADSSFFKVFNFPLKQGNPITALSFINQVVISEKAASKYFGTGSVIGKTIRISNMNNSLFTISGVAKDFPANASFQFDLIFPREADPWYQDNAEHGLNSFSDILILQLRKGTNPLVLNKKLDDFGRHYFQPTIQNWAAFPGSQVKAENFHFILRPFAGAYYNASPGWTHYADIKVIYQLISLAIVILLIACLNYILITLTSTMSRSHEVGIRKTIGAERKQIVLQFYAETQLLSFVSVFIGFVLAVTCLPFFSNLVSVELQLSYFLNHNLFLSLIALGILLGILAGLYPALVMSGLKPLNMMRNFSAYRLKPYLSRIFVIAQLSVCIILIIFSLVIGKQMRYTSQKDLGFDKVQIIGVQNPYGFNEPQNAFQLRERLFQYTVTEPAIENITSTSFAYKGFNLNIHTIQNERVEVQDFGVDYNYFSFFKIPIIKGRNFSRDIAEDSAELRLSKSEVMNAGSVVRHAVVVNETLYKMLGFPSLDAINRELGARIIGVCKDYYADDLTKKIAPSYHRIEKNMIGYFWFKTKEGQNISQTLDKLRKTWDHLASNQPFTFTFLDEAVAKSYDKYRRWMKIITASCLLAVIIACMGLFGLSGITTVNRVREIGIRKVLGANVKELFILLNESIFLMSFISFGIAIPISIYLTNAWLQNFAYRIKPDWTLFAFAGIISMAAAIIAVSYHTIKSAIANPVNSLRTE